MIFFFKDSFLLFVFVFAFCYRV